MTSSEAALAPDPLAAARDEFESDLTYLNTATVGLPPRCAWDELQAALRDWRAGHNDLLAHDAAVARARQQYARLVGVPERLVAIDGQVSAFAALVATSLPDGSEVLTADGDFTSILFPFYVQQRRRIQVRTVPLERLAESVTAQTRLVAVSAVQSADGRVLDVDALVGACDATGARVLLDLTQAAGWLPIDASRVAYTACGGYKWLLAPRGTAYFTVAGDVMDELVVYAAGWFAGEERWESLYGPPLRLAADARRFDISPAWYSWVAAGPALELLTSIGAARLHSHALGLANRFRAAADLPDGNSAIVSVPVAEGTSDVLAREGIAASVRLGNLRLSFHVNNDEADADRAARLLRPLLR